MPDLSVQLRFDGTWNDITPDVRVSDIITINRGRRDWAAVTDPATCSLKLNNGASRASAGVSGRYSPRNPLSDLHGKIGRNTPLRVRIGDPVPRFLSLPGDRSAYLSTPDSATIDVLGDIDIRIDIEPHSWRVLSELAGKYVFAGDQQSWAWWLKADGTVQFLWSPVGTFASNITITSTAAIPEATERLALRVTLDVDNGASGNTVTFYTAPTIDGSWTQLGSPIVTAGVTSIFNSTAPLEVGQITDLQGRSELIGLIHDFELRNGINGTLAADPDISNLETQTTTFTDILGNVWTLHGVATIVDESLRFAGEVSSWPQSWDLSGNDRWVMVTASGVLRRLQQGTSPLKSSMFRDMAARGSVVAYWPMEEPQGANQFTSGLVDDLTRLAPVGQIDFGQFADYVASSPIPTFNTGYVSGPVPAYSGAAAEQRFMFLFAVPAAGVENNRILMRATTSGTAARWEILVTPVGSLQVRAFDREGVSLFTSGFFAFNVNGKLKWMSFRLTQNGSDVAWRVEAAEVGQASVQSSGSTQAGTTYGRFVNIQLGDFAGMNGTAFGHAAVLNGETQSLLVIKNSLDARAGENAIERLVRLCTDENIPLRTIGAPDDTEPVGPQRVLTLLELLREAPAADLAVFGDRPDALGVQFRSRVSLYNQDPVLVVDYNNGEISAPFAPIDDDQATRNNITANRVRGSSFQAVQQTGPLSILNPPDGVGRYDHSVDVNLETDSRLPDHAGWLLHLGTVDEARYPTVRLNLNNPRLAPLSDAVLAVTEGDLIRIEGTPPGQPPGPVDLIVEGILEEIGAVTHEIEFQCSPASPWNVGVYDTARYDTAATVRDFGPISETQTGIIFRTTLGPLWVTDNGGLNLDGVTGDFASTPDHASLDIVGDLDLRADATPHSWRPTSRGNLVAKYSTLDQRAYRLSLEPNGTIRLSHSADGTGATSEALSTVAIAQTTKRLAVRATLDVDNGASGHTITFYTAPTINGAWTQLGTSVVKAGVSSIFNSTAALEAGSITAGTQDAFAGTIHAVQVRNGIGGTVVANPAFNAQPAGTTSFTDSTGKVWTVQGLATIENEFPFDILVGGERMTVTSIAPETSGGNQLFTVIRSVNGIAKSHPTGVVPSLVNSSVYAL